VACFDGLDHEVKAAAGRCDDLGFDNARKIAFLEGREKRLNEIGGAP
jgi:hypothetical protein